MADCASFVSCHGGPRLFEPGVISYNAAISASEKSAEWQRAVALFSVLHRVALTPDTISYNAAMSACGKAFEWQRALALLAVESIADD